MNVKQTIEPLANCEACFVAYELFSPGIWWCILFQRVEGGTMGQVLHRSAAEAGRHVQVKARID